MILYVRGRWRLAVSGAMLAVFLFGCFLFGALSVRNFRGLALIGVMFCVVVYRIKPQLMVWVALFSAFAAMPANWHIGIDLRPGDDLRIRRRAAAGDLLPDPDCATTLLRLPVAGNVSVDRGLLHRSWVRDRI